MQWLSAFRPWQQPANVVQSVQVCVRLSSMEAVNIRPTKRALEEKRAQIHTNDTVVSIAMVSRQRNRSAENVAVRRGGAGLGPHGSKSIADTPRAWIRRE